MKKNLLNAYIISMPFTSAFCISSSLSWPLILSSCCSLFLIFYLLIGNKIHIPSGKPLFSLFLFLLSIAFSFFINDILFPTNTTVFSKTVNHLLAYFASFINFYISILLLFYLNGDYFIPEKIEERITWVLLFSCIFAIVEFIAKNIFFIDFDRIVPHPSVEQMNALALGDIFKSIRARGLSEEPGHFAFMIDLFLPLAIHYLFFSGVCLLKRSLKIAIVAIFVVTIILTFSTAAFFALPVGLFIAFAYFRKHLVSYLPQIVIAGILLFGSALVLDSYFPIVTQLALDIDQKTSNSGSMDDRSMRSYLFQNYYSKAPILNKVIGYGPSGYLRAGMEADADSFLVLYQTFTFEAGILGMLLFTGFLWFIFAFIRKIIFPLNFFLFYSFILGIIHYFFISNYWYPWYWFICAYITYIGTLSEYSSTQD